MLILVATLVQHLVSLEKMMFYTIMISEGWTSKHWDWQIDEVGQRLCFLFKISVQFEHYYSCVGSLGISIYRIIYIKHDDWVKYKIGEKTLLFIVLVGGLLLTSILTLTTVMNDYEKLIMENCHVPANRDLLMILDEYGRSGGFESIYKYFIY